MGCLRLGLIDPEWCIIFTPAGNREVLGDSSDITISHDPSLFSNKAQNDILLLSVGPTAVEPGPFGGANSLSCIDWAHDMCWYLAQAGQIISKCNTSAQPHKTNRWDYSSQYVSKGASLCILWYITLTFVGDQWLSLKNRGTAITTAERHCENFLQRSFRHAITRKVQMSFLWGKIGKKEIATQKPCQAVDFSSVIWRWGSVSCN